jgi:hypothetical protein
MKIGVLTSSRADFGIYLPLIKKLKEDNFFSLYFLVNDLIIEILLKKSSDQLQAVH